MARRLTLVFWVLVGVFAGYALVGVNGALVALLVFGGLGLAWLWVRPALDLRPARWFYALPPAVAALVVGLAALRLFEENQLAGWVVVGLGVVGAPLLGRRAHSWPQAFVLGVIALVVAVMLAVIVFFIDVGAHGGFD